MVLTSSKNVLSDTRVRILDEQNKHIEKGENDEVGVIDEEFLTLENRRKLMSEILLQVKREKQKGNCLNNKKDICLQQTG